MRRDRLREVPDCHQTESQPAAGTFRGQEPPSKFVTVRANFDGGSYPLKMPAAGRDSVSWQSGTSRSRSHLRFLSPAKNIVSPVRGESAYLTPSKPLRKGTGILDIEMAPAWGGARLPGNRISACCGHFEGVGASVEICYRKGKLRRRLLPP